MLGQAHIHTDEEHHAFIRDLDDALQRAASAPPSPGAPRPPGPQRERRARTPTSDAKAVHAAKLALRAKEPSPLPHTHVKRAGKAAKGKKTRKAKRSSKPPLLRAADEPSNVDVSGILTSHLSATSAQGLEGAASAAAGGGTNNAAGLRSAGSASCSGGSQGNKGPGQVFDFGILAALAEALGFDTSHMSLRSLFMPLVLTHVVTLLLGYYFGRRSAALVGSSSPAPAPAQSPGPAAASASSPSTPNWAAIVMNGGGGSSGGGSGGGASGRGGAGGVGSDSGGSGAGFGSTSAFTALSNIIAPQQLSAAVAFAQSVDPVPT